MLPEGTEVWYDGFRGVIRFVDEAYMTICIQTFDNEPNRDVCLIVPPNKWDSIELVNSK